MFSMSKFNPNSDFFFFSFWHIMPHDMQFLWKSLENMTIYSMQMKRKYVPAF